MGFDENEVFKRGMASLVNCHLRPDPASEDFCGCRNVPVCRQQDTVSEVCERKFREPYKPGLGHALVIGRGGTDVEELRDFATLLLPVSAVQIEDAMRRLSLVRKLRLDQQYIDSLVQVISQVAQFSDQYRDRLVELDVNPIILDTFGNCTAVDAMMRMRT